MLENSSNERCSCLRRLGQLVLSLVAGDYIWSCLIVVHTSYGLVRKRKILYTGVTSNICIPNIPSDLNSSMSTQNLFLVRLVVRVSWYFSLFLPYTLHTSILDFRAHTKPCRCMVYIWYNSAALFTFVFYPKMPTFVFITSVISTLDTLTS